MELKQNTLRRARGGQASFNRTFMELKQIAVCVRVTCNAVLIGPSWN